MFFPDTHLVFGLPCEASTERKQTSFSVKASPGNIIYFIAILFTSNSSIICLFNEFKKCFLMTDDNLSCFVLRSLVCHKMWLLGFKDMEARYDSVVQLRQRRTLMCHFRYISNVYLITCYDKFLLEASNYRSDTYSWFTLMEDEAFAHDLQGPLRKTNCCYG